MTSCYSKTKSPMCYVIASRSNFKIAQEIHPIYINGVYVEPLNLIAMIQILKDNNFAAT